MVDWKEIGKKALDATKDITEKSVDSFQDWKENPDRISKVEKKKAEKKARKQIDEKVKKIEKSTNKKEIIKDNPTAEYKISFVINLLGKTTITVLNKSILINREGSLQTFKGKNVIPFTKISSVQLQLATSLSNGYIHFSIPGGVQLRNGLISAPTDVNSVIFSKKSNRDMKELRDIVEKEILYLCEED